MASRRAARLRNATLTTVGYSLTNGSGATRVLPTGALGEGTDCASCPPMVKESDKEHDPEKWEPVFR